MTPPRPAGRPDRRRRPDAAPAGPASRTGASRTGASRTGASRDPGAGRGPARGATAGRGGTGATPKGRGTGPGGARRKPQPQPATLTVRAEAEGPMRVQRALARAGGMSRREADRAVAEGRVTINGAPAAIGQLVDAAHDVVAVDGTPVIIQVPAHHWVVLHKPGGTMTTRRDPAGRPTVFDLVPQVPGLVYVGRLDYMTEGVLLLTTDGEAAHALTHPSRGVERTYVATVRGDAVTAAREARRGVELEDGMVYPVDVQVRALGQRRWALELTLAEGRNREVRRLCELLGLQVERLVRTRFGPVRLGEMAVGTTRPLTAKERDVIAALVETGAVPDEA